MNTIDATTETANTIVTLHTHYTPPKSAPLPDDFDEFYESLSDKEQELHKLALVRLGSSYFVQWTHMYRKWKKSKTT